MMMGQSEEAKASDHRPHGGNSRTFVLVFYYSAGMSKSGGAFSSPDWSTSLRVATLSYMTVPNDVLLSSTRQPACLLPPQSLFLFHIPQPHVNFGGRAIHHCDLSELFQDRSPALLF